MSRKSPRKVATWTFKLRYSDDNGVTWSSSVRVNDDTGTTSQFNPKISLDPTSGNIGLPGTMPATTLAITDAATLTACLTTIQ